METRAARRTLAIVAAFGMAFLTPGVAWAADPSSEDPVTKARTRAWVPDYEDAIGHATFESYGERLFACDDWPDGRTITAYLVWNGTTYPVSDENGAGGGCAERGNLPNIPEGDSVVIGACFSGNLCGPEKTAYA